MSMVVHLASSQPPPATMAGWEGKKLSFMTYSLSYSSHSSSCKLFNFSIKE